jgi:hypothetical protein
LPAADAETLARYAGAIDFARLDADITDAVGRVLRWYRRLIETPARQMSELAAPTTTGGSAQ